MNENFCFMSSGAQQRYPHDELLHQYNIDSYLGVGIKNAQGVPIGILVLLAEHSLPISAQISSLLLIFADR
ncbi:hypothetical protein, partial [Pseudoxanthomonas sp. KAs_5_3]|uniref:hypothetical protein n=1 Tax=Pseudoxanthomonas sp. KAs_5_3 TaxID=2067658 RepID=UPI001E4F1264